MAHLAGPLGARHKSLRQQRTARAAPAFAAPGSAALVLVAALALLAAAPLGAHAGGSDNSYRQAKLGDWSWYNGSATWYNMKVNFCGYGKSFANSILPAAVPTPRFHDTKTVGVAPFSGAACGSCYRIKCAPFYRFGKNMCRSGTITVVIADYDAPRSPPWPVNHFDLSNAGFGRIADPKAGIVNILWQRTACPYKHARWFLSSVSNPFYSDIVIFQVPGTGAAVGVLVMPEGAKEWKTTKHNWGARWVYPGKLTPKAKVQVLLGEGKGSVMALWGG
eukprot:jgi/Mesen1/1729/ME000139S00968